MQLQTCRMKTTTGGYGSYDYDTAVEMLKERGYGEISVIADNEDPECKSIITLENITD